MSTRVGGVDSANSTHTERGKHTHSHTLTHTHTHSHTLTHTHLLTHSAKTVFQVSEAPLCDSTLCCKLHATQRVGVDFDTRKLQLKNCGYVTRFYGYISRAPVCKPLRPQLLNHSFCLALPCPALDIATGFHLELESIPVAAHLRQFHTSGSPPATNRTRLGRVLAFMRVFIVALTLAHDRAT